MQVIGLLAAVPLQQAVDARFQEKTIVDGAQANVWLSGTRRKMENLSLRTPQEAPGNRSLWPAPRPLYLAVPAEMPPSGDG